MAARPAASILFFVIAGISSISAAPSLWTQIGASSRVAGSVPAAAAANRHGLVQLDVTGLSGKQLEFSLPWRGGEVLTATRGLPAGTANGRVALSSDGMDAGSSSWIGTVAGEAYSIVALAASPSGVVSGSIMLKGKTHSIQYREGDVYSVFEVEEAALPQEHPTPPVAPPHLEQKAAQRAHLQSASRTAAAAATADPNGQVDIAIFYTPNTLTNVGKDAIEANIRAAVVASNAIYAASKLNVVLNLVYTGLAPGYTADVLGHSMGDTLLAFTDPHDDVMDSVHTLRQKYGADAMVLISQDSSYCGLAYIMNDPSFQFPFSVVNSACLPMSLTHELGHNFGMQHDHDQYVAGVPYKPSSFGYRVPGGFSTIMAYPCTAYTNCPDCEPCPRIPYFSNPDLKSGSSAMGQAGYADATATINDPAVQKMIANWMPRAVAPSGVDKTPAPTRRPSRAPSATGGGRVLKKPGRPTGVVIKISTANASKFKVSFVPASGAAADYYTIYKKAGLTGTWKAVGKAQASQKFWVDPSRLASRTKYCYKVTAVNSIGASIQSAQGCRTR